MQLKIRGGTLKHGEASLCLSCRHATIIHGTSLQEHIVECGRLSGENSRITFAVTSCTGHSDRRQPSLHEMEEIAWVFRSDPGRRIGFVHAKDLKPEERYVLLDDE